MSGAVRMAMAAAVAAAAGCGQSPTGVHIIAHVGGQTYDELRFRVALVSPSDPTEAAGQTLVDPAMAGRFVGPFRAGDQDVVVYLRDDLAARPVRCEVTAMLAGGVIGVGRDQVMLELHRIKDLEVFMGAGAQIAVGDAGAPTAVEGGGAAPPSAPTKGRASGAACSSKGECASGHCADGVCCESDCVMACTSCALPNQLGLCRPVAIGTPDPRGMCNDMGAASCKTSGLCGASGECAKYPVGTLCAAATCADMGKSVVPARTCEADGKCADAPKVECPKPTLCSAGICQ